MALGPELYGLVLLATVIPAVVLIRMTWDKRDKPGGRWLIVTLVGMAGWSVFWSLSLLLSDPGLTFGSLNILLLFVNMAAIGWIFLTLEFSRQRVYPIRYALPFLVVPFFTQVFAWSNHIHYMLWAPGSGVDAMGIAHMEFGPWFVVHSLFNFTLMAVSGAFLINDYFRFEGIYRKQAAILFAGWLVPVTTSLVFTIGLIPIDYLNPTPIGFLVGAGIWGWGLYRFRLFDILPVARRRALDEMEEAVIVIDEDRNVADVNSAAEVIFDLPSKPAGEHVSDLLEPYPPVLEAIEDDASNTELTLERDDEERYLTLSMTGISRQDGPGGSVLVFDDVTKLKRHEHELDLLKQVLGRVLRHDMSNDLNVIRAHGELLSNKLDDGNSEYAQTIVRTCDRLIETSRKARAIEQLVDADRERYDIDIVHAVTETVEWANQRFPSSTIETDLPEQAWVRADSQIELAVRSLTENAIIHNDDDAPWVRLSIEQTEETTDLVVEDDGPGLSEHEQEVFQRRRVDPLSHSSGLGLWTVDWVVRNSKGTIDVQKTDNGTRVVLSLERPTERQIASRRAK